jgi:hypothetical protein
MEQEKETVTKLELDKPTDFRFHVAYMAYSEAWDGNTSEDARNRLNEIMSSLSPTEADYEDFYAKISQFRTNQVEFHRERIQGQRKRDYRMSEKKSARAARHKQ